MSSALELVERVDNIWVCGWAEELVNNKIRGGEIPLGKEQKW